MTRLLVSIRTDDNEVSAQSMLESVFPDCEILDVENCDDEEEDTD